MTQEEIKQKIEQAADGARLPEKPFVVLTGDKRKSFILGAEYVLQNPAEFGLCDFESIRSKMELSTS